MSNIEKYRTQEKAFLAGMERAERNDLRKPYDIMVCILSELKAHGLQITWQPGEKPKPGENPEPEYSEQITYHRRPER